MVDVDFSLLSAKGDGWSPSWRICRGGRRCGLSVAGA